MGKFKIIVKPKAEKDLHKIKQAGNKSSLTKIERIFIELAEHPTIGTGNPEKLKHQLSGFWSCRINKKDRIIYQIIEEPEKMVVIISALVHY